MHDHHHRWDKSWMRMEAMARRGFRDFGFNKGGDWGGFGGNFRIGRMLASGDLRLVALFLIEQQPRHGYDLIKAVEEKSGGFYSPSPGIVYPALTFLEEAGYVTSAMEGNKKLYTITDEGRTHLADNREAIESTLDFLAKAGARMREWGEMFNSADPAGPDAQRPDPSGPDYPFTTEQAEQFREMGRGVFGRGRHDGPGRGWGPGRGFGPGAPNPPPRPDAPDRDMADVPPEVNEARKALKKAIKQAVQRGEAEQRRVAEILRRAADEIRGSAEDDIDL